MLRSLRGTEPVTAAFSDRIELNIKRMVVDVRTDCKAFRFRWLVYGLRSVNVF